MNDTPPNPETSSAEDSLEAIGRELSLERAEPVGNAAPDPKIPMVESPEEKEQTLGPEADPIDFGDDEAPDPVAPALAPSLTDSTPAFFAKKTAPPSVRSARQGRGSDAEQGKAPANAPPDSSGDTPSAAPPVPDSNTNAGPGSAATSDSCDKGQGLGGDVEAPGGIASYRQAKAPLPGAGVEVVQPIRLAVLTHNLGPLHIARLEATARFAETSGVGSLHVIEMSGRSDVYPWARFDAPPGFELSTLFPDIDSRRLPISEVRYSVTAALEEIRPDVLAVSGWWDSGTRAALAWTARQRAQGKPAPRLLMMSDSKASDLPRRPWSEFVKRRLVGLCSGALAAGVRSAEYLESLGMNEKDIRLGYDVVDNSRYARGAAVARNTPEETRRRLRLPVNYFIATSRFVERKNLPLLIQAFALYRRFAGDYPWDLVLLGDGPMREQLIADRAARGLEASLHMPGFIPIERMPSYLGLARALVHAGDVEQWGLVVNEAMAAGLPVLVSETCGCAPELVQPGVNGVLFSPDNAMELAKLLLATSRNLPTLDKMGAAGRLIIRDWGLDRFAMSLWDLADAAIRRPAPRAGAIDRAVAGMAARANLKAKFD